MHKASTGKGHRDGDAHLLRYFGRSLRYGGVSLDRKRRKVHIIEHHHGQDQDSCEKDHFSGQVGAASCTTWFSNSEDPWRRKDPPDTSKKTLDRQLVGKKLATNSCLLLQTLRESSYWRDPNTHGSRKMEIHTRYAESCGLGYPFNHDERAYHHNGLD